jgi:DNA-binding NarL/FixJ family response regulator
VVVLDISLPGETGLTIAVKLLAELAETRVLMLSVHDNAEYVLGAVKAGAHGYLRKDSLPDTLRQAIQTVHSGGTCFGTALERRPETLAPILPTTGSQRLALLTRREREVLIGIANGRANKEIAADLGLGVRTVESYRESLVRKLGIPSVAGLTRLAIEARLVAG